MTMTTTATAGAGALGDLTIAAQVGGVICGLVGLLALCLPGWPRRGWLGRAVGRGLDCAQQQQQQQ